MALQEDLLKIVQKAALDGTLTSTAVEYTKKLIDENQALQKQHEFDTNLIASLKKDVAAYSAGKLDVDAKLTAVIAREGAVTIREKEMTKLELQAANEKQRVEDHREMFRLVFRNLDVRRNVFVPVEAPRPTPTNSYPPSGIVTEHQQMERSE